MPSPYPVFGSTDFRPSSVVTRQGLLVWVTAFGRRSVRRRVPHASRSHLLPAAPFAASPCPAGPRPCSRVGRQLAHWHADSTPSRVLVPWSSHRPGPLTSGPFPRPTSGRRAGDTEAWPSASLLRAEPRCRLWQLAPAPAGAACRLRPRLHLAWPVSLGRCQHWKLIPSRNREQRECVDPA